MRRALFLCALLLAVAPSPVAAQSDDTNCLGETDPASVQRRPGPALRFGITPGVQTGQLGTGAVPPRTPEDPARHLDALGRLRAPGSPFVLRLHRFFGSEGEAGVQRFLALADHYTSAGYLVELQLRYHPSPQQEGDIAAWTAFVRDVVRRFGANPRVVAVQVTNEVNLTFSPDSSDGGYDRAREALVQGVIAAKDEARRRGYGGLGIGFNWAYRSDPGNEAAFWRSLRDLGGRPFVAALDWVGLDAYPGTLFPPVDTPGDEGDALVNAMSALRCYLGVPGVPASVPIHIEENGFPTGPGRSEERQVIAMESMIGVVDDLRGAFNVTDYRWFNLRDGDSTSANFQTQYGLLRDDYSAKPAFARYARFVRERGRRESLPAPAAAGGTPAAGGRPRARRLRLRLSARCRHGHRRVRVIGRDRRKVRRVVRVTWKRLAHGRRVVRARVRLRGGRVVVVRRTVRGTCRGR